jgi:hypothetical protein
LHQVRGEIPAINKNHIKGQLALHCFLDQFNAQRDLGLKLSMERLKVRVFEQFYIDFLMKLAAFLLVRGNFSLGIVLFDKSFSLGDLFIAPVLAQID